MSELMGDETLEGFGNFKSGSVKVEATFSVRWRPQYSSVVVEKFPTKDAFATGLGSPKEWHLKGKLNDGRGIRARGMILECLSVGEPLSRAEFSPLTGISVGIKKRLSPQSVKYRLVGLYEGTADCDIDGWQISLRRPIGLSTQTRRLARRGGNQSEGLVLELCHRSSSLPQYDAKYRSIAKLLALAAGEGVTAHRMIAIWSDSETYELWRHRTGDELGPGAVLPNGDFGQFLSQVLPIWESWPKGKREVASLAIDYINLSATGYLDSRVFQIMQAWEFLANAWGTDGRLSPAAEELKTEVRSAYKKWRKSHQADDPDGFVGGRLMFAFNWQRVKNSIVELAASRGLDLFRLGVDLDHLKKARDSVAHTGKLPADLAKKNDRMLDFLIRSQNALQLLLLSELRYQGNCYVRNLASRSLSTFEKIRN
jgi:hypothetical protein